MNRRSFLKYVGAAALTVTFNGVSQAATTKTKRPNVLLILTDDQGAVDVGCYGSPDLVTPNIDNLAKSGVRFNQFYAAAPICSPSRAALLTGRCPQRAQLATNVPHYKGAEGMPGQQVTIAEMMRDAGYNTAHIGKWHVGSSDKTLPNAQGFDYSFGHIGGCIDNYSHYFYWAGPNKHDLWRNGKEVWYDGQFFGDLMVNECKQFLDQQRDKPFFMYWAINFPHYPLQGKEKWRKHYEKLKSPRRQYAAFVSTMDELIGEVLDYLDEKGLRDNTIVIFQSDHGHSTEMRSFGGGGDSGPYRGAKFSLFEGGIRVPAIISWPDHLPENEVRQQMAISCDWMPTIADLCNLPTPNHKLDGKSLTKVIKNKNADSPHKTMHWHQYIFKTDCWAVRQGKWKLLGNPIDTSDPAKKTKVCDLFLADLEKDISEKQNLAAKYPDIVTKLKKCHDQWFAKAKEQ